MACVGLAFFGCGSRTDTVRTVDGGRAAIVQVERCNGLDDDGVNGVDDPFRDAQGRYLSDSNCGACNRVCAPRSSAELVTHCALVDQVPRCVAQACAAGSAPTHEGRCESVSTTLCLACANDNDCGALAGAVCTSIAGEARCSIDCKLGCPSGYQCDGGSGHCVPVGGSCSCSAQSDFDLACAVQSNTHDAGTPVCVGRAMCTKGVLSSCQTSVEVCDHADNDCDGQVDEGFADARGAYSLDQANCGECGVSCVENTGSELDLACGGDPFAPTCTLACPDARNGIMIGDLLDGDLDIATGCECKVSSLSDAPGPAGAVNAALDVNCDGADGDVRASFYVATDGDDSYPGSPTRPLRTIGSAIDRARASLATALPRPHVFVASGTYTETIELAEGVLVHGGYRRDFRALDPVAFLVSVHAPAMTSAPGGAALVASGVGSTSTVLEGFSLFGLDATRAGAATFGAYVERPGQNLTLRALSIRAGVPGEGTTGTDGPAGSAPASPAREGDPPRAAIEQGAQHVCSAGATNVVAGGAGGQSLCAGSDVSGGVGGQASCPVFERVQGSGAAGNTVAVKAGGGAGGQDSKGPITGTGGGCSRDVCCGLADFSVPTSFHGPSAGQNGGDGLVGSAGTGCSDALGLFSAGAWVGGKGTAGSAGIPGAGGGGGGAGGGVQMSFMDGVCEFPDGLGGGGGGGGGGGCGGGAGREGTSGGPSVALLIVQPSAFSLDGVVLQPAHGGGGGPGGAGGDGGLGGSGAAGGLIAPELRTTPTLAGPFPGARGGSGGAGGPGGGGGGGCGGSSVGLWLVGGAPANLASWRSQNRFMLSSGGEGGVGGGGARVGSNGARGEAADVVIQQ